MLFYIRKLIWTKSNIEHIGFHHITVEEVEEGIFENVPFFTKGREDRIYCFTHTPDGKYLFIVLAPKKQGAYYVITAREMTKRERTWYNKKKGGRKK